MAVNLSPVGGVAAQFFNNDGTVLSGGKIYTYLAGTTSPAVTYTTSSGGIAHSNPIILNSAGRVPGSGEVWLTDGITYKFVLTDANDVQIGTWDNIVGINSNFINFTNQQEIQTATAGQTIFTLTTMQYQPGTGSLSVFVDGVNQYGPGAQYAFTETSSTIVTFVTGLHVGASVKFTTSAINASSYGTAFDISYTPPFTASVATNVGDKLAQTVSVTDFGAVGDGVTNDTAAIQAAFDYCKNNGTLELIVPAGTYLITSQITKTTSNWMFSITGEGYRSSIFLFPSLSTAGFYIQGASGSIVGSVISGIQFKGGASSTGVEVDGQDGIRFETCYFEQNAIGLLLHNKTAGSFTEGVIADNCLFETNCIIALEYRRTSGNSSFHGSGMRNCWTNDSGTSRRILIGAGCQPYNAPLSGTFFGNSSPLIECNSVLIPRFDDVSIFLEGSNWTLAITNAVLLQGDVAVLGATAVAAGTAQQNGARNESAQQSFILQGAVYEPRNPAFLTRLSTTTGSVTGDGTAVTVPFDNVVFERHLDGYSPHINGAVFTAPVSGIYEFFATVNIGPIAVGHTTAYINFNTNTTDYQGTLINPAAVKSAAGYTSIQANVIIPMTAGAVVSVELVVSGAALSVAISGGTTPVYTYFSGRMVG